MESELCECDGVYKELIGQKKRYSSSIYLTADWPNLLVVSTCSCLSECKTAKPVHL